MDCWLHIPLAASSSLCFVVITWLYTARAFVIYHTECNFLQLVQLVRFNPIIHNQRASFCKCTAKNWMLKHPPRCFSSGWLQACVLLFFFLLTINKDHQCLSDAAQPLNQKKQNMYFIRIFEIVKILRASETFFFFLNTAMCQNIWSECESESFISQLTRKKIPVLTKAWAEVWTAAWFQSHYVSPDRSPAVMHNLSCPFLSSPRVPPHWHVFGCSLQLPAPTSRLVWEVSSDGRGRAEHQTM